MVYESGLSRLLRSEVEREEDQYLWGQAYRGTPRLVWEVFGDGRQWVGLSPLNSRPNYYVVRVDSRWHQSNWCSSGELFIDHLDDIYWAIEEEFGEAYCGYCGEQFGDRGCEECEDRPSSDGEWPALDAEVGSEWFDYRPRWLLIRNALLDAADAMCRADAGGA